MGRIIVVEDNPVFADYVCRLLASKDFQSVSTFNCNDARKLFAKMQEDDIVLADMRLPDGDGIALLAELRKQVRNNPYIVMTEHGDIPIAVRSLKLGAEDFIPKNLLEMNLPPLLRSLQKRAEQQDAPILERTSEAFRKIYDKIRLVAPTNMSVLILGESGTGKEHIAEKIHASRQQETGRLGRCGWRHVVPRRDRQPAIGSTTDAAPRVGSQAVQTHGRQQGQESRRAHHCRHQRGLADSHCRKAFPGRPLPTVEGIYHTNTAIARVPRGHNSIGGLLPATCQRGI